ncbi:MAG: hypothetical protein ABII00_12360 [Elusimicrobiota bacterium]
MVVDSAGDVHLACLDWDPDTLRHIKRTGSGWTSQFVDSAASSTGNRWKPSIDVDDFGGVHIAYHQDQGLMYARFQGLLWDIQLVDPAGAITTFPDAMASIAVDDSGNPHISYCGNDCRDLKYAVWTGVSWSTMTIAEVWGFGLYSSLALDPAGKPHIAYNDHYGASLGYGEWNGVSWSTQTVEATLTREVSIAVDSAGIPHIAYGWDDPRSVKYARWTGVAWSTQTVSLGQPHQPSIVLDSADNPEISFIAEAHPHASPMYAKWNGRSWISSSVEDLRTSLWYIPALGFDPTGNTLIIYGTTDAGLRFGMWVPDTTGPLGIPSVPVGDAFSISGTMTFAWGQGSASDPESGISGYYIQIGTDSDSNDASIFDGDVGDVLSQTISGAQGDKIYYARVRARNLDGDYTGYSGWSAGTLVDRTAPDIPTAATSPSHPNQNVAYPAINPAFNLSGPNDPSGIAGYHWMIDRNPGGVPAASDDFSPNPIQARSLLTNGTWYFHAVAKDGAGNVGTQAIHYKFIVDATVDPAGDSVLETADGVKVEIPAGALSAATLINIQPPVGSPPSSKGSGVTATSVIKDIQMVNGTTRFQKDITITLTYTAVDVAGMDEASLRLFYYDESRGYWVLIPNSSVNTVTRKVTGRVDHFTLFGIMAFSPAASALESLTNYPNPFSPLRGQQTRIRYSLDQNRDVRIRIYDPFGRLARDTRYSAGSNGGRIGPNEVFWDGRSGDGRHVEMGGYICVVDAGGKREIVKIGVK